LYLVSRMGNSLSTVTDSVLDAKAKNPVAFWATAAVGVPLTYQVGWHLFGTRPRDPEDVSDIWKGDP
jgi:hypothetical protein